MKKLILSAFLLGAFYSAQAQTNLTATAATSRAVLSMSATEMTRQMYNDLKLNEAQYIKLKKLNQTRLDRFNEIDKMYSNDQSMRDAKMKEISTQLDEEFAKVLTPAQFTTYLESEGRSKDGAYVPSQSGASSTNYSAGSVDPTPSVEGVKNNGKSKATKSKD